MREAHPLRIDKISPQKFDLKQSRGGMIDIEFMVQYLILRHAHDFPELCENRGNIALLLRCSELGLIPHDAAHAVSDIYRHWRKLQHMGRLQGNDLALINAELTNNESQQVIALWDDLLG